MLLCLNNLSSPSLPPLFPSSLWIHCLGLSNKHIARKVTPSYRNFLSVKKRVHSSLDVTIVECECMLCSVHSLPRCLDLLSVSCLVFRSEVDPLGQRKACFDIVIPVRKLCMCQYTQDQDVEVVIWILAPPRKALCLGTRASACLDALLWR